MADLQNDLNDIGAAMRELHQLADASGDPDLAASAAALHGKLGRGFARHIRPEHPELDWDAIAGNQVPAKGAQTRSGGKHEPTADGEE